MIASKTSPKKQSPWHYAKAIVINPAYILA
jgi:hypothetical protein